MPSYLVFIVLTLLLHIPLSESESAMHITPLKPQDWNKLQQQYLHGSPKCTVQTTAELGSTLTVPLLVSYSKNPKDQRKMSVARVTMANYCHPCTSTFFRIRQ